MQRAVFFDRDGIINKVEIVEREDRSVGPVGPRSFDEFRIFPDRKGILSKLKAREFLIIIITNQPDIARGLLKPSELAKMHDLVKSTLPVDDIYFCPHDDADLCECRKPKPGMLIQAAQKWNIDLKQSFFVGDQWKDMEAGGKAGCKTILLDYPYNREFLSDFRVDRLEQILDLIS